MPRTATQPDTSRALRQTVQQVQVAFPQIYLACHTRHQRKQSTTHHLSARDASILAHLDAHVPLRPATLSTHLGIARSTLSEALKKLGALGYVSGGDGNDSRRRTSVLLTERGAAAIRDTSVLETPRLMDALEHATPGELRSIARGLNLLAQKCRGERHKPAQSREERR